MSELLGRIDVPVEGVVQVSDAILEVRGWVVHPRLAIRDMWVWSEGVRMPLQHGLVRLDVEWDTPEIPRAARSGFAGRVAVPAAATHAQLEVWVELDGGQRVRWQERSFELVHRPGAEGPIDLPGLLTFHLETPAPRAVVGATLAVRGWVICHRGNVRRIWATTEDGAIFPLRHGVLRPDVVEGRNLLHAPLRGFEGVVVLPSWQSATQLCFWAELDSGETVLIVTRSVSARQISPRVGASASAEDRWRQTNRLTPRLGSALVEGVREGQRPLLSLVYAAEDEPALASVVESLRGQLDPRWELCVAFDSRSVNARRLLRETSFPPRVRSIGLPGIGNRLRALHAALDLATAERVAMVGPGGTLTPDAVHQIAGYLAAHPEIDWLYTDHEEAGRLVLKSDWDPDRALSGGFPGPLSVVRRERLNQIGRLRCEGAEEWDLQLRLAEEIPAERIGHLARVCYRQPRTEASPQAAALALGEALLRRNLPATVAGGRLRWDASCLARNPVTIVIPTRDRGELLRRCVESLRRTVDDRFVEILIIDDDSSDPATLEYLASLQVEGCRVVRLPGPRAGFDYARLMNGALPHVQTPLLLHLNNDVQALEPGWLEQMVGWLQVPGVGIVGATLVGEDGTVQHAGVVVGPHGGLADHALAGLSAEQFQRRDEACFARDVSAVTGACLLLRTELYRTRGGFDGQRFRVDYNDVDLCLRAAAAGHRTVVTPERLIHLGQASRGAVFDPAEHLSFLERHPGVRDGFVNENLSLGSMALEPDPHRYVHADRRAAPLRLLVYIDGRPDPATCVSLLRAARREHQVLLLAPEWDRAFELELAEAGVVRTGAPTGGDLRALGETLQLEEFDLVIAHGWASHRGIELAEVWRKPSLWHLCQQLTPEEPVVALLGRATRVCFSSQATALRFAGANHRDHHRVIEAGAPLRAIAALPEEGRAARRAIWKLDAGELAIAVAADRDSLDPTLIREGRVRWLPLGRDPGRDSLLTLAAADLLFIPQVLGVNTLLLQAMALGIPLLAPRTPENAEVVASGEEGLLFTDDSAALLRRLVDDPVLRRELGRNALAKARRLLDADLAIERTLRLIKETVLA